MMTYITLPFRLISALIGLILMLGEEEETIASDYGDIYPTNWRPNADH